MILALPRRRSGPTLISAALYRRPTDSVFIQTSQSESELNQHLIHPSPADKLLFIDPCALLAFLTFRRVAGDEVRSGGVNLAILDDQALEMDE